MALRELLELVDMAELELRGSEYRLAKWGAENPPNYLIDDHRRKVETYKSVIEIAIGSLSEKLKELMKGQENVND